MFSELIFNLNGAGCEKERALTKNSRDRLANFYKENSDTVSLMMVHLIYKYITENKVSSAEMDIYKKAFIDMGVYMSETVSEALPDETKTNL